MRFFILLMLLVATSSHANDQIRKYFEAFNSGYPLLVHGDQLVNNTELQRFYLGRNHDPVWYKNGVATKAAEQLYLAIETSGREGLQPEDYHNRALQTLCSGEQKQNAGHCDLLFSDAFFLLAQHLMAGRVNPETLTPRWPAAERQRNLVALLRRAVAENNVKDVLATLRPAPLEYQRLIQSLQRLRAATRYPEWNQLEVAPALEPGQSDDRLQAVVDRLVFWGDMEKPNTEITAYEESLVTAVQRFQERHGLAPNGVIDEATFRAFNVGPTQRAQQIIANLERMRWLDEDLGVRHLVVNLADSSLEAVNNDQTAFFMDVVVGADHRDLPVFSSQIRHMVLNSQWVLPRRLADPERLPALRQPERLAQAGFTAYRGDESVPLDALNWEGNGKDYRLVQAPGPHNAMGRIRFAFPNNHGAQLHGAPEQDLLNSDGEFIAGSIRVEEPVDLAVWLLDGHVWSPRDLRKAVDQGSEQAIYLAQPVPVHLYYRTAWVNNFGVLNFRNDVLERDSPLYEALNAPLRP